MRNLRSAIHQFYAAPLLPMALFGASLTIPASVVHATIVQPDEVIVTARRTEEVIQNVPISMTVFNQEMLDERNVVNAADLAAFTPSLNVDTRFGSDQASFAIRGFTQEFRTTASVAVYFADVVAPRGSGSQTAGDGAGPGSFFDLQNVQVLKGPQGTLFGRNTTGGAIQLTPQEPTTKLEGYLEQSAGNYNMRRTQGVLNVPISDMARSRFGFDTQKRDGHLKNVSGIGPDDFADTDYIAARASLILDLADSVQNYTIASYTKSETNGNVSALFACDQSLDTSENNPNPSGRKGFSEICDPTIAQQKGDFYAVSNDTPDPSSELKQWQVVNRTTWDINDDLTVKNILSYAELETVFRGSIYGANFKLPANIPIVAGEPLTYVGSGTWPGIPSVSQTTFVEELQFSGTGLDERLTWQAGLYYENSKPDGVSGSLSPFIISCPGTLGSDPSSWVCFDALGVLSIDPVTGNPAFRGSIQSSFGEVEYLNQAVYSQATYDISDEWRVTLGARYTVDESDGESFTTIFFDFPSGVNAAPGGPGSVMCTNTAATGADCHLKNHQKSEAPTWLIGVDYLPTPDVMVYAKYARGYRQGSVNIFAPEGLQSYEPEQVDAYELGAKTSFRAVVSGTFNIALFYNELKDQQIQAGYVPDWGGISRPGQAGSIGGPTTAIINAGASTIQGIEAETTLKLTDDLGFTLGYTYLETRLDSLGEAPLAGNDLVYYNPTPGAGGIFVSADEGGHLPFSPRHNATMGLSYRLPLPAEVGDVTMGMSYTYVSDQLSTANTKYGWLGERNLLNLNMGWKAIFGSPFDAGVFVTNATDEEVVAYVPGFWEGGGMEARSVGAPRMYGARIKYNFGL